MSYTIKHLRAAVSGFNNSLIHSLSNEFIREQGRNGYQATDGYKVRENGDVSCDRMIGGGTSREVEGYSREFYYSAKQATISTRAQCKRLLLINGFDLEGDFHQVSTHELCDLLVKMAKLTKYRRPQNANGSTARYFFKHLQNRITLDENKAF